MGQKVKAHRHIHGLRPGQVVDVDDLASRGVNAAAVKAAVGNGAIERVGKDTAPGVETRETPAEPDKK
jgi:hypothetical protein